MLERSTSSCDSLVFVSQHLITAKLELAVERGDCCAFV